MEEEKGVADVSQAIDGARDIIAEQIADRADFRRGIRSFTMNHGILEVRAKDEKESSVYEMYYNFQEKLSTVTGYRILAINMIGTMVICSILILSRMFSESYLIDVALIYAMVSFISVLILATIYIPVGKKRGRFEAEVREEVLKEREALREEESA